MLTHAAVRDMFASKRYGTGPVTKARVREGGYSTSAGQSDDVRPGGNKVAAAAAPLARHEQTRASVNMDQVSLTGDAIAAVVLGCAGTGQGLGGSVGVGVSRNERSLNWRAEPASHARLECIARHDAVQ
jgi:hypothetical protein